MMTDAIKNEENQEPTPELAAFINGRRLLFASRIARIAKQLELAADEMQFAALVDQKAKAVADLHTYEKKLAGSLPVLNRLNFPANFRREYEKRLRFTVETDKQIFLKGLKIKEKLSRELHGFDRKRKLIKYVTAPE